MPVGRPTIDTPTYLGRVVTCDPTQRIIDVALNASGQRIQVMTTPICARWPMVGETWTVHFVNNTPYLGEPYQTYQIGISSTQTGIEEIPVGDAWIHSPTGVLHVIGSPNGSTDFSLSKSTLGPLTSGAWINPTLLNSWTTFGSSTVSYLKDPFGFVHLRGRITGGASASVVFLLPAGFRPGVTDNYSVGAFSATSVPVATTVQVATNGNVQVWFAAAVNQIGLGNITFLAEN